MLVFYLCWCVFECCYYPLQIILMTIFRNTDLSLALFPFCTICQTVPRCETFFTFEYFLLQGKMNIISMLILHIVKMVKSNLNEKEGMYTDVKCYIWLTEHKTFSLQIRLWRNMGVKIFFANHTKLFKCEISNKINASNALF